MHARTCAQRSHCMVRRQKPHACALSSMEMRTIMGLDGSVYRSVWLYPFRSQRKKNCGAVQSPSTKKETYLLPKLELAILARLVMADTSHVMDAPPFTPESPRIVCVPGLNVEDAALPTECVMLVIRPSIRQPKST